MQFVPSFDFGAAVQGVSKGMDDWNKWQLAPIERDLAQARLDNAQMDLLAKSQTQAGAVDATNSTNRNRVASLDLNTDLLAAGRPGQLAQAEAVSRSRVATNELFTPEMATALAASRLGTAQAQGDLAALDAQAALARAGQTNAVRDRQVDLLGQQVDRAGQVVRGEMNRNDITQATLNNEMLARHGLSEARLATIPEQTRNMVAGIDLAYRQMQASGAAMDRQEAAGRVMDETYALTRRYADLRQAISDPAALQAYVAEAAGQGRTITVDQAKVEIDQRSTDLARAVTAMQGRMNELVRNNDTSNFDQTNAWVAAGRAGTVGGSGQPGAGTTNAVAAGGTGVFRTPAGGGGVHAPNLNPPTDPAKPKPVKEWSVEQLTEARKTNPAAQKEIDNRNIASLEDLLAKIKGELNPSTIDFGFGVAPTPSISNERRQALISLDIKARSDLAAIKARQKIEKDLLEQKLRKGGDIVYPTLIGG